MDKYVLVVFQSL